MHALKRNLLAAAFVAVVLPAHAAAPLTQLKVALGDVSINKVPFLIAADAGLYAKYGLEVHQFITPGAAAHIAESGVKVPPEFVSNDNTAPISSGGGSPTIYGMVNNPARPQMVIVSTTEDFSRDHIVAVASIKSLADLKGKKLGYTGVATVTHYNIVNFVKKMGWDPDKDVTLIARVDTLQALKDGKADAFASSAMTTALAPEMGFKDLGDLSQYKIPLAGSGIMVEKKFLAANRDTVLRFLKASIAATELMKTDRKVFNAAIAKWFNVTDPKIQDRIFAATKIVPAKPYPSVAGIKAMMVLYDSPAMKMHKAEEFYDSTLIAELDKDGFLDHPLK